MMDDPKKTNGGVKPQNPSRAEIERFYAALPVGKASARTAQALAADLGLIDPDPTPSQLENAKRRIRLYSEYAVFYGYVYCADNEGYYRPAPDEIHALDETIGRRESQAHRTLQWCAKMRANVSAALYQGSLL